MNQLESKIFANALNQIPELGPVRLSQLFGHFGSWQKAWASGKSEYLKASLPPNTIDKIISNKSKINPEQSFAEVSRRQIQVLLSSDIVVEADLESGSLITANYALEQNREVFAVPGSIFSQTSRGTNELIRRGAHIVTGIGSILDELNLSGDKASEPIALEASDDERLVLGQLSKQALHLEDLTRAVHLLASAVTASLTMLEMKGRIKNLGAGNYIKIR